jgi:hypothetical protein
LNYKRILVAGVNKLSMSGDLNSVTAACSQFFQDPERASVEKMMRGYL